MEWKELLIRYGELSTKGRNRNAFTGRLRDNIRYAFADLPKFQIITERDRMFIRPNEQETMDQLIERLPKIFGIQSFSPVASCSLDLEDIKQTAVKVVESLDRVDKTFKVTVKRSYKPFEMETNELQQFVGSHVLRNFPDIKVQMKKPDIDLVVEVRRDAVYMMAQVIPGAGGLPIGSNGKSILMLSGGIDSPVAGYQMLKRGVRLDAIHFYSPPYTSELSKEKVMELADKLSRFGASVKLHIIPFTAIQQEIQKQIPSNVSMTTTRRMMLRITDLVREETGALAIITGESLGQVASQTLESLTAINAVSTTPVLRPLIAFDKLDIIKIAQEIDTYEVSIRPYEDCCTIFTPSSPKTKPKLEKVEFYESFKSFDDLIAEAVGEREVMMFPKKKQDKFSDLL
ncbi:tRNA uracil 4-sulfurtransferase ThiI [Paenisporosarcina sp. OV554]|uniref:tRNA uracil 4-sulfurtransferase ThiI n=1 Tax=Paenisporosarcina sp. OV554 TaxID=2135694 RepID=UPI000D36FB17|nr:tRNA uracil 4-sulfurtransferase ThiI [Paenisporosarcina sp. OV554]PUB15199.1 thiamine biosynthesis protein ThiI [Paenisporosarcina sp. OV554]